MSLVEQEGYKSARHFCGATKVPGTSVGQGFASVERRDLKCQAQFWDGSRLRGQTKVGCRHDLSANLKRVGLSCSRIGIVQPQGGGLVHEQWPGNGGDHRCDAEIDPDQDALCRHAS